MCGLLVGCGSPPPRPAALTETATPSSPTVTPTPTPPKPQKPFAGEWEDRALLGEPLVVEADLPFAEILYAARGRDTTYVATGAREGDLILRTIVVTMPDGTDDIQLYGGDVLGERGPDERVERGRYWWSARSVVTSHCR